MTHTGGRKPPTLPPRNRLAATGGGGIGKPPPLPYRAALAQQREKRRVQQQGRATFGGFAASDMRQSVALPFNPREAARQALTGTQAATERARARAKRKVDEAQRRMMDEMRQARADGRNDEASAPTAEQPTNRPPQRTAGRYDGLKGGEPG